MIFPESSMNANKVTLIFINKNKITNVFFCRWRMDSNNRTKTNT